MRSFLPGGAADHPRIRGEHINHQRNAKGRDGSSPHTRGARVATPPYPAAPRIIPAYAGSTLAHGSRAGQWPDHPRIRGEHTYEKTGSYLEPGSSPHTRGARRRRGWRRRRVRIIPAYAGSTHPPGGRRVRRFGSSPHTRGARGFEGVGPLAPGIIPAYAGSTRGAGDAWPSTSNHPRIRGEHAEGGMGKLRQSGSSPHTRGAPARNRPDPTGCGIIPAYAGSTCRLSRLDALVSDHPRIRGEHDHAGVQREKRGGSSPHTRGAHGELHDEAGLARIIPAYAGSTRWPRSTYAWRRDHPRIRGEHERRQPRTLRRHGSSPHTRGAHLMLSLRAGDHGIIPAYAGSTSVCAVRALLVRGSSPHTRGARQTPGSSMRNTGIIPAYAGST